jgi:hypothetical protein
MLPDSCKNPAAAGLLNEVLLIKYKSDVKDFAVGIGVSG